MKQNFLFLVLFCAFGSSFWLSSSWLLLCAGLALFLFGMQCPAIFKVVVA